MLNRRVFLQCLTAGSLLPHRSRAAPIMDNAWFMPDESAPHRCTWMAFGADERIWGRTLLPRVREDLARIARAIARYEPVFLLARERETALARRLIGKDLVGEGVELIVSPLDDLWIRDTGPVFLVDGQGGKAALDLNFNGWGYKQAHRKDAQVASFVADQAGVRTLATSLILEGGCIEVDGEGAAIITESCTLNDNRNPGVSKAEFEDKLMPALGLNKIIWLPGLRGMDITDGHTDFYARFARPGVVLAGYDPDPTSFEHEVTLEHLEILRASTDASGRSLEVLTLEAPKALRYPYADDDFAGGYLGFYVCNGAVIMQNFGDREADAKARETLRRAFPGRVVESLDVDGLAAGGGSIHCATQQEPKA